MKSHTRFNYLRSKPSHNYTSVRYVYHVAKRKPRKRTIKIKWSWDITKFKLSMSIDARK